MYLANLVKKFKEKRKGSMVKGIYAVTLVELLIYVSVGTVATFMITVIVAGWKYILGG